MAIKIENNTTIKVVGKLTPYAKKDFTIDDEKERLKNMRAWANKTKEIKKRGVRITEDQRKDILEQHNKGFSVREVANRMKLSKSSVARIVRVAKNVKNEAQESMS